MHRRALNDYGKLVRREKYSEKPISISRFAPDGHPEERGPGQQPNAEVRVANAGAHESGGVRPRAEGSGRHQRDGAAQLARLQQRADRQSLQVSDLSLFQANARE